MQTTPAPSPLKPCPHCGSAAILHQSAKGYLIVCQNTNRVPCDIGNTHNDWSLEKVVDMWNARTSDEQIASLTSKLEEARKLIKRVHEANSENRGFYKAALAISEYQEALTATEKE